MFVSTDDNNLVEQEKVIRQNMSSRMSGKCPRVGKNGWGHGHKRRACTEVDLAAGAAPEYVATGAGRWGDGRGTSLNCSSDQFFFLREKGCQGMGQVGVYGLRKEEVMSRNVYTGDE